MSAKLKLNVNITVRCNGPPASRPQSRNGLSVVCAVDVTRNVITSTASRTAPHLPGSWPDDRHLFMIFLLHIEVLMNIFDLIGFQYLSFTFFASVIAVHGVSSHVKRYWVSLFRKSLSSACEMVLEHMMCSITISQAEETIGGFSFSKLSENIREMFRWYVNQS